MPSVASACERVWPLPGWGERKKSGRAASRGSGAKSVWIDGERTLRRRGGPADLAPRSQLCSPDHTSPTNAHHQRLIPLHESSTPSPFDDVFEVGADLPALLHRLEKPVAVARGEGGVAAGPDGVPRDLAEGAGSVSDDKLGWRGEKERTMTRWRRVEAGSTVASMDSGMGELAANLLGWRTCRQYVRRSASPFCSSCVPARTRRGCESSVNRANVRRLRILRRTRGSGGSGRRRQRRELRGARLRVSLRVSVP